ncbi:MAG: alpha/beta fold hydrolase, partial [Bacteroidota bacterium]
FDMTGKLVKQITNGDWEVDNLVGIDQSSRKAKVYYTSTEGSPMERYFFSIGIDGKRKQKLTADPGVHRINMSNDFKYYIDSYSSAISPLRVSLHLTKGNKLIKVLEDNAQLQATAKDYNLSPKEFFTFPTVDGTSLNGFMLKPSDFDASKQYPVLIYQYSGPGSQNVMNSWAGSHYYWHQMLTQKGYIVAVIDTRGTGGRGEAFKKITYEQLGKYEVEDHIEGAMYLAGLSYIDDERIGIWGWSYGGYMSSLAIMKGADVFNAAIAVAPVTNWRFYDTIYTERYMGKPQDNPNGYDNNSPTSHVSKLKGNYLLIHGTGDDNVHFQNAVTLQNALIASGKQFDSFYYPDRAHSIFRNAARPHLFNMITDWVLENL